MGRETKVDMLGHELNVGDQCLQLYQYKELRQKRIAKLSPSRCTFDDKTCCSADNVLSLTALGITPAPVGSTTDAVGSPLSVGDAVLFIDNSCIRDPQYMNVAFLRKGIVSSLGAMKVTVNAGGRRFSKERAAVLSLTAHGIGDLPVEEPDLDSFKNDMPTREEMIEAFPWMRNYHG